jgi:hypothetical protein
MSLDQEPLWQRRPSLFFLPIILGLLLLLCAIGIRIDKAHEGRDSPAYMDGVPASQSPDN